MGKYEAATQPTMYFIGVTTATSSIMKVFPKWAQALGLKNTVLKGIDIPIHADPQEYIDAVEFIKNDPLSLGALVTTHKLDLYKAAKSLFDYSDPYAQMFGELSSISKRDGKLCAHAKDPISSGLALEHFVPANYWADHPEAEVFIMGAGGSAISMCSYLLRKDFKGNYPKKIVIANRSKPRLDALRKINENLLNTDGQTICEYYLTPDPGQNDDVLHQMAEGSLIINATGLGKDRPGSPLTDSAEFPQNALVWEINYRGDLNFKHQAEAQQQKKNLVIEDGWCYFIHGWTQVIAEVFGIPIEGELLQRLDKIAAQSGQRSNPEHFHWEQGDTIDFDLITGLSSRKDTTKRYLSQMRNAFADQEAVEKKLSEGDELIYEFHELDVPETMGDLMFGISIVYPGKIGDEYYMTKGHFHSQLDTAEVYYTLAGEGYMMIENPEGDWSAQPLKKGEVVYVPKRYAHRSINTGKEPLHTFFVFRADAGHDYGTIETKGYRNLVVERDGKPRCIPNAKWQD